MASPRKLRKIARRSARKYGVDPNVFERQINAESGFRTHVTSSAGAQGIAQFMPGTARSEGVDPNNPRQALKGAARLDAKLIKQLGYRKGLAAYNAGPGNIGAGLGYADSILHGSSPKGRPSPSGGGESRSTTKTTTTTTTPGVDNSDARRQLVAQYLAGNHSAAVGGDPLTALKRSNNAGVNLSGLIANLQQNQDVPGTSVTTKSRSSSGSAGSPRGGTYPLGKKGKVIGTPHAGTHTLGNWQSDDAVDIAAKVGTPVYAARSGTISKAGPLGRGGSRFAGDRVQIDGKGDSLWYGHLSKLKVRAGQRVRKGDLLGYSGSANGVGHLHFASEHGDPRRYLK